MKKLLIISFFLLPTQLFASTYANTNYASSNQEILNNLNEYRKIHNLEALIEESELCALAKIRVEEIQTDWSHGQFQKEIDKLSERGGVFHENLARRFEPSDVVWAWSMSTMGHREAMLIPDMKYGCVAQIGDYYAFEGYIPS